MTLHNLSTVITPNLFRPFESTANDLIFACHLVETFKVMIVNLETIFELSDQPLPMAPIDSLSQQLQGSANSEYNNGQTLP